MTATMIRNKNKTKTKIDWDLNVWCPEQWYGEDTFWDQDLWMINARVWQQSPLPIMDTDYTITLLTKEAEAIGLVDWAKKTQDPKNHSMLEQISMDGWLDFGLDGFIDLDTFMANYKDRLSLRILEFLETLPKYIEDLDPRMVY